MEVVEVGILMEEETFLLTLKMFQTLRNYPEYGLTGQGTDMRIQQNSRTKGILQRDRGFLLPLTGETFRR